MHTFFEKDSFVVVVNAPTTYVHFALAPGSSHSLLGIYTSSGACTYYKDTTAKTHEVICLCKTVREALGFENWLPEPIL